MKNLFYALMLLLCCMVTNVQAKHINLEPGQSLADIPVWMTGPVWFSFVYDDHYFTAVHVFTDEVKAPYILLTVDKTNDRVEDEKLLTEVGFKFCHWWNVRSLEEVTDRDMDLCTIINVVDREEHKLLRTSSTTRDIIEAFVSSLAKKVAGEYNDYGFTDTQLTIFLKDDAPQWVFDCMPYLVQED
jgi:hypothetical protein